MRIISLIVIFFTLSVSVRAEIIRTYHDSVKTITDSVLTIQFPQNGISVQAVEMRASLPKAKPGKVHDGFGIRWGVSADMRSYYYAQLQPESGHGDEIMNSCVQHLTIGHFTPTENKTIASLQLKEGFGMESEENTLGVDIDRDSSIVNIYGGNQLPTLLYRLELPENTSSEMGVYAIGSAEISLLVSETITADHTKLLTHWTSDSIDNRLKKASFPEGRYRYLDRETDPRFARQGGKYELAVIGNGSGGYDILYLSGAEINADRWKPGMLKGRLKPTIFTGHYDLEWFDADMNPASSECHADIEQTVILKLSFPLLKSVMRFSLLPQDK